VRGGRSTPDSTDAHVNNGLLGTTVHVGGYRVVFSETDTGIIVTGLGPRGSIYD